MGSSPSKPVLRQAQVQILRKCEFCNTDKDINYKCNQCQVYTCKKCGIIHHRSSPNHDITETGSDPPTPVHQRPENVHQAQLFMKCGYCQNDRNIHYICSQCQTYMCLKCSIIHQQLTQNHKINSIRSFHSVSRSQTETTERSACEIHKKKLVKFCSSCLMKPVCSECILAHKDHHLLSLDDQTLILQGILSKDLAFTSLALTQILKQEFENNLIFKNLMEEVEQREKSMETDIANYTKLCANMDTEQRQIQLNFIHFKTNINHIKQILKGFQTKLQAAMERNDDDNILKVLVEILSCLPEFHFNILLQEIESLVPRKTIETARSFGIQVQRRKTHLNINMELLKSYETNLFTVQKIITQNNQKALISDYQSQVLRIMHINDNIITSKDLPIMVRDMSVTPSNEILLNLNKYNWLHLFNGEGVKPFLSVTPNKTFICCVHVTKYNEIILGVKDYCDIESLFKVGNESNTKVMIFGMDKKQKQSFEYNSYRQRLFTTPYRITTNINNEILVIDKMSFYHGRVVVINRKGQVRWIYQGHPKINSSYKLFDPLDFVTTKVGQIIVTDHFAHALHVLSEEGYLLSCKVVKEYGILFPWSLDIDISGKLWIGCRSGGGAKKAKLHITNLSFY